MHGLEVLSFEDYLASLILKRDAYYPSPFVLSAVGGGGKTTTLLHLFADHFRERSILTTTTSMGAPKAGGSLSPPLSEALKNNEGLSHITTSPPLESGVWFSNRYLDIPGKHKGVDRNAIDHWVREERKEQRRDSLLLCEADGAKRKPLKAYASHEPVIPETTDLTAIVFGLSALGKPFDESIVHRSNIFSEVTGKAQGEMIDFSDIEQLIGSGHFLKGIPLTSKVAVILNQADILDPKDQADENLERWAHRLLAFRSIDAVFFTAYSKESRKTLYGVRRTTDFSPPVSAVIMAAGLSKRMEGKNKLLLPLMDRSVVSRTMAQSLRSDIRDFVVVTGHEAKAVQSEIGKALEEEMRFDQQLSVVYNRDYQEGQGTSVALGTRYLAPESAACFFIPGDQPFIEPLTLREIIEHWEPETIVIPLLGGRRASPVLFDRMFYDDLSKLTGDLGGRQVIMKHESHIKEVEVSGNNPFQNFDLDTPDDYKKALREMSEKGH
ncbi:MAG: selenium cofactor biosynthesis protein YqeC [Clostridia bacterium]|jgi:molybdenum cofactor cytidylyltransferase|nr:selenium cofactor biosynthesis protein YqeC [Clostridia bacterium]